MFVLLCNQLDYWLIWLIIYLSLDIQFRAKRSQFDKYITVVFCCFVIVHTKMLSLHFMFRPDFPPFPVPHEKMMGVQGLRKRRDGVAQWGEHLWMEVRELKGWRGLFPAKVVWNPDRFCKQMILLEKLAHITKTAFIHCNHVFSTVKLPRSGRPQQGGVWKPPWRPIHGTIVYLPTWMA